jgi:lipoprotein-releasing system permease protein
VISIVSLVSVMVSTGALFVVLSIFNGLQNYVSLNFNSFNADLAIFPKEGKTFSMSKADLQKIQQLEGIYYLTEVLSDVSVFVYEDRQFIAKIKGVYPDYYRLKRLDTMVYAGEYLLQKGDNYFAILGSGVANRLKCATSPLINNSLTIYYPNRNKKLNPTNPSQNIITERLTPFGFFASGTDYDGSYVFVPIDFARKLMNYTNQVTSIEIGINSNTSIKNIKENIIAIIGSTYEVKDAYQQENELYKVMKSEKMAIYLILSFILLVASFNIIGMIAILVLDKQKDINVLYSLGADNTFIKRIFMFEGMLISLSGAIMGLIIGGIFCWLQIRFHFIHFGDGSYLLNYYPVQIYGRDIVFILLTVTAICFPATYIPVVKISEKIFKNSILK